MRKYIDESGKKFNRLTVIGLSNTRKQGRLSWDCICDCGASVIATGNALRLSQQKSCGCLQKEKARNSILKFTSENISPSLKHGMAGTRIYETWKNIKRRCLDKKSRAYKWYGGRGIKVCQEWDKFENFYIDMGASYRSNLTIDRIDVSKGYSKENCRWVGYKVQANNRTSNHLITFNGKTQNIQQWAEELGIPRTRINNRVIRGFPIKDILFNGKFPANKQKGCKYIS